MPKNAPNRRAQHVYAVLRFDPPTDGSVASITEYPSDFITVKELVPTEEEALHEVARLSALNAGKGVVYFVQIGRLYPEGRGLGVDERHELRLGQRSGMTPETVNTSRRGIRVYCARTPGALGSSPPLVVHKGTLGR
jgi:hypothetical protein